MEQPFLVAQLRVLGHDVYDFKNPPHGRGGFSWKDIDPNWEDWSMSEYEDALRHEIAERGYASDFEGMQWADICILVLPCGASAHTEAGFMKGLGKKVFVYGMPKEAELMYKVFDGFILDTQDMEEKFDTSTRLLDTPGIELFGKLPPWVEVQGVTFQLYVFKNGRSDDVRLCYKIESVGADSPHAKMIEEWGSWLNPFTGGLKGFLFLTEGIGTEDVFVEACIECENFLKRFNLWTGEGQTDL
jgi:hypothetical protein